MIYTVLTANNYDDKIGVAGLFPSKEEAFACMVKAFRDKLKSCNIDWDVPDGTTDFNRDEDGCLGTFTEDGYSLTHDGGFCYAHIAAIPGFTLAETTGDERVVRVGD